MATNQLEGNETRMNNDTHGYKCPVCGRYMTIGGEYHKPCELKMDKLYAVNTLFKNKIISFDEYKTLLSDIVDWKDYRRTK